MQRPDTVRRLIGSVSVIAQDRSCYGFAIFLATKETIHAFEVETSGSHSAKQSFGKQQIPCFVLQALMRIGHAALPILSDCASPESKQGVHATYV